MISWSIESYPGSPVSPASAASCAVTSHCRSLAFTCCRQTYTAEPTGFGEPDGSSDGGRTGKNYSQSVQMDKE